MTPQDVPDPVITIETLTPWLQAITPAVEPVRRPLAPRPASADGDQPLRPAA